MLQTQRPQPGPPKRCPALGPEAVILGKPSEVQGPPSHTLSGLLLSPGLATAMGTLIA